MDVTLYLFFVDPHGALFVFFVKEEAKHRPRWQSPLVVGSGRCRIRTAVVGIHKHFLAGRNPRI